MIPQIREILLTLPGKSTVEKLNSNGEIELDINGEKLILLKEDILIESVQAKGFSAESDHGFTVALETELTTELIEEGFVREIVSKIQTMRKEAGFEVLDRIILSVSGNEKINWVVLRNTENIKEEVLADKITNTLEGYEKEWEINGEMVKLSVKKV